MKFISTHGMARLQPYSEVLDYRMVGTHKMPVWFNDAWFANDKTFVIKHNGAFTVRNDRTRVIWTKWLPYIVIRYVPKFNRFDAISIPSKGKTVYTDVLGALMVHRGILRHTSAPASYFDELYDGIKAWMYTVSEGRFDPYHFEMAQDFNEFCPWRMEEEGFDISWMIAAQYPMLRSKFAPVLNGRPGPIARFLKYPDPKQAMHILFGKKWDKPMMRTLLEHSDSALSYKVMQGLRKLHPVSQLSELFTLVSNDFQAEQYYMMKANPPSKVQDDFYFRELDEFWTSLSDARRVRILREDQGFMNMSDALRMVREINFRGREIDLARYRTGEEMHRMALELYNIVTAEERQARAIGLPRPVETNEEIDQDPYKELMSVEFPEQIKLIPPKDTNTMIQWGNMFNFCIGSYRQEALNGELFFAVEYQGNLIGCGHLRGKTLVQMLAKYNQNMPDNVVKAIVGELQFNNLMNDNVSGWGLDAVRPNDDRYNNNAF